MAIKLKKTQEKSKLATKLRLAKKDGDRKTAQKVAAKIFKDAGVPIKGGIKSDDIQKAITSGAVDYPGLSREQRREAQKALDNMELPDFLKRSPTKGGPQRYVQFKVMGGKAVKQSYVHTFNGPDTVDEARRYFAEFSKARKYNLSSDGRIATFPGSVDSVVSNMPITEILRKRPVPKAGLPEIDYSLHNRVITMPTATTMSQAFEAAGHKGANGTPVHRPPSASMKSRACDTGQLIPLKVICGELKLEPRAARMILRKAVKDPKKYPDLCSSHAANARWEWPKDSKAIADVRKALSK